MWLDFEFLSNDISYCLYDILLITLFNIAYKIQIWTPEFIFLSLIYTKYQDGNIMHQISFSQNDTMTLWFLYSDSILCGSFCNIIKCAQLQSIVHMVRQSLRQNMHQRLYAQKTPHILPSQANCVVSIILRVLGRKLTVITAPHRTFPLTISPS